MTDASLVEKARVPTGPPPFTLADIRRAIPSHCFKKSALRSLTYLAQDIAVCSVLWIGATYIDSVPVTAFRWLLWPLYWFAQGAFATGLWVLAHECGHGAFSDHGWLNDSIGLVFHSILLVPYFSWKHSHRRHHQNTGSVSRDEVFVPAVQPLDTKVPGYANQRWYKVMAILRMLLIGWPVYLLVNASGRAYDRWANHFDPYSPIFKGTHERIEVVVSDVALASVLSGLAWLGKAYGWMWLVKMYVIPYLWVNHWLVMITYLQHTHPNLPHYDDKEWDWLRGAMATVDRSYGFLDPVLHHIADTHVVHHLFSYMPHYHAQEATQAVKKVLGKYYAFDSRNVFVALWQDYGRCFHVSPDQPEDKVYWYRH